jgi:hypothetical protein
LIRDKLRKATLKLKQEIDRETNSIRFQNRLNLNKTGVDQQIAGMWAGKIQAHVEMCYDKIYCHHWNLLGHRKTGAFVRACSAILGRYIESLGGTEAHKARRAHRAQGGMRQSVEGLYKSSAGSLRKELEERFDIEARELDLAASIELAENLASRVLPGADQNRNPTSVTTHSDFWRDLAEEFLALRRRFRYRAGNEPSDLMYSQVEALATRGASEIASAGASDLLAVWLEALRKERVPFQFSGQSNERLSADEYAQRITKGTVDGICRASAALCKKLEAQALKAEFDEKHRNVARTRTTAHRSEVISNLKVEVPASQQRRPESVPSSTVKSNRRGRVGPKPPLLQYRSGVKRAILVALTKTPTATDADICRTLDADGTEELPTTWRSRSADRSFFVAYSDRRTRHRIEVAISKMRRDLRQRGLLD